MKPYTRIRKEQGVEAFTIAEAMGVSLVTYKRIEKGYGNIFEDACIRHNLGLPERTDKHIQQFKP